MNQRTNPYRSPNATDADSSEATPEPPQTVVDPSRNRVSVALLLLGLTAMLFSLCAGGTVDLDPLRFNLPTLSFLTFIAGGASCAIGLVRMR